MTSRAEVLIMFLDRLVELNGAGFEVTEEMKRCVTEIERDLCIGVWDKYREHRIPKGFSLMVDNEKIIDGPTTILVLSE